jgi:hypothetical protein
VLIVVGEKWLRSKNQSVVKTIRLPYDLNQYLTEEAKNNSQTASSFIISILLNYRNKYQFMEKLNSIALRPTSMALFVNSIDERKMHEIADTISSDFLVLIPNLMTREETNWFEWGVMEFLPSINWYKCLKSNRGCLITHGMGTNWTTFLKSFFNSLFAKYPGEKPIIEVDRDVIIIKPRKTF